MLVRNLVRARYLYVRMRRRRIVLEIRNAEYIIYTVFHTSCGEVIRIPLKPALAVLLVL